MSRPAWLHTPAAKLLSSIGFTPDYESGGVVVLHDIEQGCLPRLPELLRRLNDLGVVYEQDYPESLVLTRAGKLVNIKAGYISD